MKKKGRKGDDDEPEEREEEEREEEPAEDDDAPPPRRGRGRPPKKKRRKCPSCDGALDAGGFCQACDAVFDDDGDGRPAGVLARIDALEKRVAPLEGLGKLADKLAKKFTGKSASDLAKEDDTGDDAPPVNVPGGFIGNAIRGFLGMGAPAEDKGT